MKEGKIRNVRDFEMNVPGEKRKTSVSQLESRIVFAEDSVSEIGRAHV